MGEVLIEGAQGQDLDINYGLDYPHVTSRMCSASQLIADAGVSAYKVKDIFMIIRPYPIRISNKTNIGEEIYSGDYCGSQEISWEEVARRCGCNVELKEYTTVTKKVRRVFEMNWERLKYNVMINQPTGIVLNFAQYIDWKAYKCRDYNKLPLKVKQFISKIENETNTPVVMIGTGEEEGDIIDIDITNHSMNVRVSDEEMSARKAKWQPREPRIKKGYLVRYASLVTSADKGAVLQAPEEKK